MQKAMIKALLGAALMLTPGAVAARHAGTNAAAITVNAGELSLQQWNGRVARSLNDHLEYPSQIGTSGYPEGAVRLAFHCSENGTPADVTVVQSSRSQDLDRSALYAVQHISTLHPLPVGIGHDRSMEAWVFFASDQAGVDRMKKGFEQQVTRLAQQKNPSGTQTASLPPLVIASR